ncbi:hypothetical protein BC829DRAFT_385754 [Chytridium lagenaria]|nr:hypothetical protein BC829DRAFT_385754 [Chytridium lagenaria]
MIVSAVDLKRLTQQIDGAGMEEKVRTMIKEDRDERFRLSKARVKNWDNTISGQRRKKLEARKERMAAEEEERIQADIQYAREEAERRRQAIDRAKRLQYNNQDSVRAFHSRVLLYQVLKERDMQLDVKQQRQSRELAAESSKSMENNSKFVLQLEDDARYHLEMRRKQMSLAQEQQRQIQEKLQRAKEEKYVRSISFRFLHAKTISSKYRESLKKEEQTRKLNCRSLRDELMQMKSEIKTRESSSKLLQQEEKKRIEAWIARKSRQNEMKKEVEKTGYREEGVTREEEEAERSSRKKVQQQELRDYFQEYREKKLNALRDGKALQDHHREQMERIQRNKKKEKETRLEEDRVDVYRVDQEEWAQDDHRLQRYVSMAPEQPKKPRPPPPVVNTHLRLGFAPI